MPIKVFSSPFKVTQEFGVNPSYYSQFGLKAHEGLDIIPTGSDWSIFSLPYQGQVVKDIDMASKGGAYGVTTTIWYKEIGEAWQYCHMSTNTTYEGQITEPGQYLGQMGSTGNTSGAHLHVNRFKVDSRGYRLDKNNGYLGGINPLPFLENEENPANITQPIAQQLTDQTKYDFGTGFGVMELGAVKSTLNDQKRDKAKLSQDNQDLETACEELKKAIKTVDDFNTNELIGALIRKLKG